MSEIPTETARAMPELLLGISTEGVQAIIKNAEAVATGIPSYYALMPIPCIKNVYQVGEMYEHRWILSWNAHENVGKYADEHWATAAVVWDETTNTMITHAERIKRAIEKNLTSVLASCYSKCGTACRVYELRKQAIENKMKEVIKKGIEDHVWPKDTTDEEKKEIIVKVMTGKVWPDSWSEDRRKHLTWEDISECRSTKKERHDNIQDQYE